jgi:hypothetical protein
MLTREREASDDERWFPGLVKGEGDDDDDEMR